MTDAEFSIGIEEEYLLVDAETGVLREAPDALMHACKAELDDQVSPEFLRCQIEIGTPPAANIAQARQHLARLRDAIARQAAEFGLAPISVACHPEADWRDQDHTDKTRYNMLTRQMGAVARRMLICGMHVHVGIAEKAARIDLMNQMSYFMPHLLALSTSSPFWQAEDTQLASYRTTVFGGYPRTGLPPQFGSWEEYDRAVAALTDLGIIEDASKIWWDLRPSGKFPTLETRVCDACPRLSDTITLAALIQATLRMLMRLARANLRWRQYDNFLLAENRWMATRHGMAAGLIDFGGHDIRPFPELAEEWLALIAEDANALDSQAEVAGIRDMIERGGSSAQQRSTFNAAIAAGADRPEAFRAVVMSLIADFRRA